MTEVEVVEMSEGVQVGRDGRQLVLGDVQGLEGGEGGEGGRQRGEEVVMEVQCLQLL